MGQAQKPSEEIQEVTSPFKSKSKAEESKVNDISQVGLGKEKKTQGRGKLKQEAKEKGKARNLNILAQPPLVGTKRGERPKGFENGNERPYKRACEVHNFGDNQMDVISMMATTQHLQEQ